MGGGGGVDLDLDVKKWKVSITFWGRVALNISEILHTFISVQVNYTKRSPSWAEGHPFLHPPRGARRSFCLRPPTPLPALYTCRVTDTPSGHFDAIYLQ